MEDMMLCGDSPGVPSDGIYMLWDCNEHLQISSSEALLLMVCDVPS